MVVSYLPNKGEQEYQPETLPPHPTSLCFCPVKVHKTN